MNIRPKIRNAVLVGALAAVTATAWATNESISSDSSYVPANTAAVESTELTASDMVLVSESLSPNESVVLAPAPVAQDGIIVQERRLSEDERIQILVMDRLANNPQLSGKIGVESHDSVVTLSGYTSTAGQASRAGREARSVIGVKYVQNEIRPRIGGSVS